MRKSVDALVLISLLCLVGCGSQAGVKKVKQCTIDEIVAAYSQAQSDGQYATHLGSMLAGPLASLPAEQRMLQDMPGVRDQQIVKTSHEMKEVDAQEIEQLSQYFEFPVVPTHVLEIRTVSKDDQSTVTSVSPVYLVQNGEGWNVVVGVLKSQDEIEKSYEKEQLTFNEDDGIWKQHWELQFGSDSDYDYEIVLQQPESVTPEQVVLAKNDVKFLEDRKVIRFHLLPEGAEQAFEPSSTGGYNLPYAYQAGKMAMSASVELPMETISVYEPNRAPKFEGDAITLARFISTSEADSTEYVLLLKRSPKQ